MVQTILGVTRQQAEEIVETFDMFVALPLEGNLRKLTGRDLVKRNPMIYTARGTATVDGWWVAAAIAGAVVAACAAAPTKLKPVEKLKFAIEQLADFEDVALRAENGLADGGGAELVNELTARLAEISRREPPD